MSFEPKLYDYQISTITMSINIPNCILNIINIGKYLEIDETIIGLKYQNVGTIPILKGKYSTCIYNKSKGKNINKINKKSFYNQISLIIKFKEKNINVKLFENGSLHITGIKDVEYAKDIILIIYNKLKELNSKNVIIILLKDSNNILLDNENNIYSFTKPYKIIGYKSKNNEYYIYKKLYNIKELTPLNFQNKEKSLNLDKYEKNVFISSKIENKRTKSILNLNGDYIGYSQIELLKNNKKFYKNNVNITYEDNFIFYNSTMIGNIKYNINDKLLLEAQFNNERACIEYIYNCNPFKKEPEINEINETYDVFINSINIYFNILFEINRNKLFNKLLELNYLVQFSPETYSGIILTFKKSLNENKNINGICNCSTKCTCSNITFIIFQSGNILVSGLKSQNVEYINQILRGFKILLNDIKKYIVKK